MVTTSKTTWIAYYRVSTDRQGRSGLGLEGQRAAVEQLARESNATIVKEFVEVESGKNSNRPEIAKAIRHARRVKGVLVIAKLDRLARNVYFVAGLMESGVEFMAADMPFANRLTVHILSAIAEHEARCISERTKTALAMYKARGGLLGASLPQCRNLNQAARERGARLAGERVNELANESCEDLYPLLKEWVQEGATQQVMANRLNEQGYVTRRGKPFSQVAVLRVLRRMETAKV